VRLQHVKVRQIGFRSVIVLRDAAGAAVSGSA
jgi:hypothetical protein